MSNSLALITNALSVSQIVEQRNLVMAVMKGAMKEGTHYGKVPGCGEKPTLLLPGAQLLGSTFLLVPSFSKVITEPMPGHMAVDFTCYLDHNGIRIAEGVGFCSSMESKYRFRNSSAVIEDTGQEVPKDYWNIKDSKGAAEANKWLGTNFDGERVGPKKIDGVWHIVIFRGGGDNKVENQNPSDQFNTILKIGKKRSYVDAIITATACNDLFTQDLEDIRANLEDIEGDFVDITPKNEKREEPAAETHSTKTESQPDLTTVPEQEWKGISITKVIETKSKPGDKKPWVGWLIEFSNGKVAGTFSTNLGPMCMEAWKGNPDFRYDAVAKPGKKKDRWELISITEEDNIPMEYSAIDKEGGQ